MANDFVTYKGFKIEETRQGFILWGKSLFNPIDISFSLPQPLENCKKTARGLLKMARIKEWPTLFNDRICKN